jgi:hypothetical protein
VIPSSVETPATIGISATVKVYQKKQGRQATAESMHMHQQKHQDASRNAKATADMPLTAQIVATTETMASTAKRQLLWRYLNKGSIRNANCRRKKESTKTPAAAWSCEDIGQQWPNL